MKAVVALVVFVVALVVLVFVTFEELEVRGGEDVIGASVGGEVTRRLARRVKVLERRFGYVGGWLLGTGEGVLLITSGVSDADAVLSMRRGNPTVREDVLERCKTATCGGGGEHPIKSSTETLCTPMAGGDNEYRHPMYGALPTGAMMENTLSSWQMHAEGPVPVTECRRTILSAHSVAGLQRELGALTAMGVLQLAPALSSRVTAPLCGFELR